MKKQDAIVIPLVILFFLPFFLSETVYNFYRDFNKEHGMIMSFVKFAILATFGEVLGLRIKTGAYYAKGFGILPRAIVWGFLGLVVKISFFVVADGMPRFVQYMGVENAVEEFTKGGFSLTKLLVSFCIAAGLNILFSPLFMTFHKVTDAHITNNKGTVAGLFKPIKMVEILENINWSVQWNFIFKKTIPFFWIPTHTIVFLLPPDFQILAAAALGVVLGVILALANLKSK